MDLRSWTRTLHCLHQCMVIGINNDVVSLFLFYESDFASSESVWVGFLFSFSKGVKV